MKTLIYWNIKKVFKLDFKAVQSIIAVLRVMLVLPFSILEIAVFSKSHREAKSVKEYPLDSLIHLSLPPRFF